MTQDTAPRAEPVFIGAPEVAELLGLPDADAFLRRRRALEDDLGFPLSLPYWKRPLRYRRDAVLAWRAEQGLPKSAAEQMAVAVAEGVASGKVALLQMARTA